MEEQTDSAIMARSKIDGLMKILDKIELSADIMCCRFTPDGQELAVGVCDGVIEIVHVGSGNVMRTLVEDRTDRLPVTQIVYFPNTNPEDNYVLVASYAAGCVRFWEHSSGKCLAVIYDGRQTLTVAVAPEGKKLVTAGSTPNIFIYDIETKKKIQTCEASDAMDKMDGHRYRVFVAKFNINHSHMFVTGGWDDSVQYWDERQMHSVNKFHGPHICGDALDIELSTDTILTGSWRKDDVLQVWDYQTAKKLMDIPQDKNHPCQLYCTQWLGKEHIIGGGSSENLAHVIDLRTLTTIGQICNLQHGVYCLDNDRKTKTPKLAIGSGHSIYILRC